ncbi:MAG: ABC transporter ATP-binding protein [Gemmatimonadota bacterium]|nr:MAG: ABC transporter ATP-binding protein [Gemmatimonadota bacterium]
MSQASDVSPKAAAGAPGDPRNRPDDTVPAVRARGVCRFFRSPDGKELRVLRGVDLEIGQGEMMAIMGPSGAGKSTLLHVLGALDQPTSGSVEIAGRRLDGLADTEVARLRNELVGFVFQFHHLLRDFSALENVMLPRLIAGVDREEAEARAVVLLEEVGLGERLRHRPNKLSGGEQQRVAVARALVNEPPLLLADEPSGNLDTETSKRLHDVLFGLVEHHGSALIVVTHDRELAERAGRVQRLVDGVLEAPA